MAVQVRAAHRDVTAGYLPVLRPRLGVRLPMACNRREVGVGFAFLSHHAHELNTGTPAPTFASVRPNGAGAHCEVRWGYSGKHELHSLSQASRAGISMESFSPTNGASET